MVKVGIKRTVLSLAVPAAGTTTYLLAGASSLVALLVSNARSLVAAAKFVYGSAGTTVDLYVQTSMDAGVTWIDIMNFHFTTSSATKVSKVTDAIALAAAITPGDGALTANTILDGLLGDRFKVKMVVVGAYVASTIQLDLDVKV